MHNKSLAACCIAFCSIAIVLGLASIPPAVAEGVAPADIAVVVSLRNPITNISLVDLRRIFAGEKRTWPAGLPIKLLVRSPGCRERQVLLHLLNMSEGEYKQYWSAQILRGEANAEPAALPSVGMQKEAVILFPGSITLVDASDIKPGMKIIKVDGLLPGATGYPLH